MSARTPKLAIPVAIPIAITTLLVSASLTAHAAKPVTPTECAALPTHSQLRDALVAARKADNAGFNLEMWGAVVARSGTVCAVAFTGKGLGETHAERALSRAVGEVDRSEVKVLRGQILHEILQFRATLRDELEDTADADFEGGEALVFGYFDELTVS